MGFFDKVQGFLSGNRDFGKDVSNMFARQSGFDKKTLQGFMKQAGNLASSSGKVDTSSDTFGPQFENRMVFKSDLRRANELNASTDEAFATRKFNIGENRMTEEFSQDQVKGFIDAFKKRQDEVYGRRAQPGTAQTRLV